MFDSMPLIQMMYVYYGFLFHLQLNIICWGHLFPELWVEMKKDNQRLLLLINISGCKTGASEASIIESTYTYKEVVHPLF